MEFHVVLERDVETGTWIAEAPGVPGAYAEGRTKDEALENLRDVFGLLRQANQALAQPEIEFATIRVGA